MTQRDKNNMKKQEQKYMKEVIKWKEQEIDGWILMKNNDRR